MAKLFDIDATLGPSGSETEELTSVKDANVDNGRFIAEVSGSGDPSANGQIAVRLSEDSPWVNIVGFSIRDGEPELESVDLSNCPEIRIQSQNRSDQDTNLRFVMVV